MRGHDRPSLRVQVPGLAGAEGARLGRIRRSPRRSHRAGWCRTGRLGHGPYGGALYRGTSSGLGPSARHFYRTHRARTRPGVRRGGEEDRFGVDSAKTDEQAPVYPIGSAVRVDPPVHDPNGPPRARASERPLGGPTELGSMPRRRAKIPRAHQGRGNGPLPELETDGSGAVARGPFGVRCDGDDTRRAGPDPPVAGHPAGQRSFPDRRVAVAVTFPSGRGQGCPQHRR